MGRTRRPGIGSSAGGGGGGGGGSNVPNSPSGNGYYLLQVSGGVASWVIATTDEISAGFTPTLALVSGGNALVEIGTPWTPVTQPNPLANAAGVTAATIQDTLGNSANVFGQPGTLAAPVSGGTYTSANSAAGINAPNAVIGINVTETKNGVTKTTNTISRQVAARVFSGFGGNAAATGLTQSGGGATIGGTGTTQTGQLATGLVGVTGLFGVIAGANNFWSVSWDAAFGASHTFKDNLTGFGIPVTIYGPFTSATQTGVSRSYYVAITSANVGTSNFEPYFAT